MADQFDPYYEWLGIPPKDQPPHHYRLLGIELFEQNPNVIERAGDRQMGHVRSFQSGRHSKQSQRLLNELSTAKVCLLNPQRKVDYDQQLEQQIAASSLPDFRLPRAGGIPDLPPEIPEAIPVPLPAIDPRKSRGPEIHFEKPSGEKTRISRRQKKPDQWIRLVLAAVALICAIGGLFLYIRVMGDNIIAPPPKAAANTKPNPSTPPPSIASAENPPTTSNDPVPPTTENTAAAAPVIAPPPQPNPPATELVAINEAANPTNDPTSLTPSPAIPPEVEQTIVAAAGIRDDRFAFCQTLPWKQFDEINRPLREQGYRLSRFRPYLVQGDWRVAAIWLRDGLPSRLIGFVDATTIMEADQRLRDQGFMPVDCVGITYGPRELFGAVWVQPKSPNGTTSLTLGIPADGYKDLKAQQVAQGYRPAVHLAYFDPSGNRKYCDLWIKTPTEGGHFTWTGDQAYASQQLSRSAIQTDVSVVTNPSSGDVLFTGAQWLGVTDDLTHFVGQTPDSLRNVAVEQTAAGNSPCSLSIASTASGELVGVAVWRPANRLQTPLELASFQKPPEKPPTTTPTPALVGTSPAGQLPADKLPPPSTSEEELVKIREVFKNEIAAAKEPAALVALAEKLLGQAMQEQDPAIQYALFGEARRLAIDAADWNVAARVIDEKFKRFNVDPWVLRAETFSGLSKKSKSKIPSDRKILAETAVAQAEAAVEDNAFEAAEILLTSAANLASRGERDLVKQINDLRKRSSDEKKAQQLVTELRATLTRNSDDGPANEALGKYLCFTKEDWEAGLPHLAKGLEGKLASLAKNDQAQPADATDRMSLADAWADLAKTSTDSLTKSGAASRALHWYQLAIPDLMGVKKRQAEKQIEDLSKSATGARGKVKFAWLEGQPGVALELRGHTADVTCLAVARSGRFLVSGSRDDTVRIWDLTTGKQAGQITPGVRDVHALLVSPDDRSIAMPVNSAGNYSIGLWSIQNGQPIGSIKADNTSRLVAGSQDWRRVAYAKSQSGQGNILVYNLATLTPVAPLNCPGSPVSLAMSRSGRYLAAADDNNVVYVWDLQTGKAVLPLTGHNQNVSSLAFSPNERQLVSCGFRSVIVWDLTKGVEERRITPANGVASAATFSPDGSRLLVSGLSTEITIFSAKDGTQMSQLNNRDGGGSTSNTHVMVCFPDGRAAATVGSESVIRVWRLPQ